MVPAVRCWSSLSLMCLASSLRGTTTLHPKLLHLTGHRLQGALAAMLLHITPLHTAHLTTVRTRLWKLETRGPVLLPSLPVRKLHLTVLTRPRTLLACFSNSPTQPHPLPLYQQRTRIWWTLRRQFLSSMHCHCSPLHRGQGLPSFRSLVATSSERWWPQHDVS